jgi:hypothetical protein
MPRGITITHESYKVRISVCKHQFYLGAFDSEKEAKKVYAAAADKKRNIEELCKEMFESYVDEERNKRRS